MSNILKGLNESYFSRDEQDQQNAMDTRRRSDLSGERNSGLNEPDEFSSKPVQMHNGIYEYDVPAGQEKIAQELGLQFHKGHWFSRIPFQRADFQFGRPQFHAIPSKNVSEAEQDYGADYQDKVQRLGQMAKQGERKTVWDPVKRVYKTVPVNPPKEQGVAEGSEQDTHQMALEKLQKALKNPNVPAEKKKEIAKQIEYQRSKLKQGVAEGSDDKNRSVSKKIILKNLIKIAKEQGNHQRVQKLELELKKLDQQGVAEGLKDTAKKVGKWFTTPMDVKPKNVSDAEWLAYLKLRSGNSNHKTKGVEEGGIVKSIKRGMQGWGAGGESDAVSPKDVVQAFGKMDGQRLANFVASRKDFSKPRKNSARAFADKVIDREMKQRGYGRVANKDEQGVAEGMGTTPKITFAQQTPGSWTRIDILVDGDVKFQAVKTMGPGHWTIHDQDGEVIGNGGNKTQLKASVLDYLSRQGVAEGLSKRDQKDVDAIRAAIARLESQLNHPNADRDAIQQSIAHEKKRLALYGQDVAEEKQRLDPSCWKGYKKQGTKMKGDTRVNNCVPVKESAIMKGLNS